MKLTGNEDLRVQKTMRGIRRAFEELLCEKDYPQITVKELCERAQINKKTFYRYYPTLNDLLVELQDDIHGRYMERTEGMRIPEDLERITREFCLFSAEQGEVYERITCAPSFREMSGSMQERVFEERPEADVIPNIKDDEEKRLLMAFVTEATLGIYRQWAADGKKVSVERMTAMTIELVCGGVERLTDASNTE